MATLLPRQASCCLSTLRRKVALSDGGKDTWAAEGRLEGSASWLEMARAPTMVVTGPVNRPKGRQRYFGSGAGVRGGVGSAGRVPVFGAAAGHRLPEEAPAGRDASHQTLIPNLDPNQHLRIRVPVLP
jgi:hypothetical protein